MVAFATVDDLSARVPEGVAEDQRPRAEAYLSDASDLIRDELGRDWPDRQDVPSTVRRITLAVALRCWLNPAQMTTTGLGDYSATHSNRGGIWLTDDERRQLSAHKATSDLWVQPLGRPAGSSVHDGTVYVPSGDGGSALPLLVDEARL